MFEDRDTAITVREHMANVIWLLTAGSTTSPVTECSSSEQQAYNQAILEICNLIETTIVNPIERKHPDLFEQKHKEYKKQKFRRRP